MKDRQLNKDAVAVQQSEYYAHKATHKQETKFVTVVPAQEVMKNNGNIH